MKLLRIQDGLISATSSADVIVGRLIGSVKHSIRRILRSLRGFLRASCGLAFGCATITVFLVTGSLLRSDLGE
jgi:hypothetical protein